MMQDRFKFRVWDCIDCEYIEDSDVIRLTQYGKFVFNNATNNTEPELNPKRFVFEQCTGLKDKNGKLIYEGDIVEQEGVFYKVIFSYDDVASCGCCIDSFSGCGFVMEDKYGSRGDLAIYSELEIIGNIHENADLFKTENE